MRVYNILVLFSAAKILTLFPISHAAQGSTQNGDELVSLHGVGSASPCLRLILQMVEDQCKHPCRFTFRFSEENAHALFSESSELKAKYAFGASHKPLSSETYNMLTSIKMSNADAAENVKVHHFPYSTTALGLFSNLDIESQDPSYTQPSLNFTSDLIAQMFLGKISTWTDEDFLKENPAMKHYASSVNKDKASISIGYLKEGAASEVEEKVFSMAAAITRTWSEYLATSNSNWPETAVGEKVDWPSTISTKFLTAPTAEELITKILNDKGLALAFLPVDAAANVDGLSEAAIFSNGIYQTSSEVAARGDLYNIPSSIVPKSSADDFSLFNSNLNVGDQWPLLMVEYLFIRSDVVTQRLGPEQRGLLLALLKLIFDKSIYIEQCHRRGYGKEVHTLLKHLSIHSIDLALKQWTDVTEWEYESGDEIVSSNNYVLTEQRRGSLNHGALRNLHKAIEEASTTEPEKVLEQIQSLETMLKALTNEMKVYENGVVATSGPGPTPAPQTSLGPAPSSKPSTEAAGSAPSLGPAPSSKPSTEAAGSTPSLKPADDKIPLTESDNTILFTDKEKSHLNSALVLGSIAFTLWAFSILGRTWWYCTKEIP
mmetsp:Transcript_5247/g.8082  ORF Transcript_5247/g.8082 Transcript_5247/m.8082 type:complete len:602 (+) Transcript_5247:59-1864(+)